MAHKGVCILALLAAGCGDAERKPQTQEGASGNGGGGNGGAGGSSASGGSVASGGMASAGSGGSVPATLDTVCDYGPLTIFRQFNGTLPYGFSGMLDDEPLDLPPFSAADPEKTGTIRADAYYCPPYTTLTLELLLAPPREGDRLVIEADENDGSCSMSAIYTPFGMPGQDVEIEMTMQAWLPGELDFWVVSLQGEFSTSGSVRGAPAIGGEFIVQGPYEMCNPF